MSPVLLTALGIVIQHKQSNSTEEEMYDTSKTWTKFLDEEINS